MEVCGGVVTKLADAVGEHGVGAGFALGEAEEAVGGEEWNTPGALAIEAGDDGDGLAFHVHQPVSRDGDAGLLRESQGENFACGDVAGVVGFGELRDSELAIPEGNGRLRSCATEGRALGEKVAQVRGRFGFVVDGVGGVQQRGELDDWGDVSMSRGKERTIRVRTKAERADA